MMKQPSNFVEMEKQRLKRRRDSDSEHNLVENEMEKLMEKLMEIPTFSSELCEEAESYLRAEGRKMSLQ